MRFRLVIEADVPEDDVSRLEDADGLLHNRPLLSLIEYDGLKVDARVVAVSPLLPSSPAVGEFRLIEYPQGPSS